VRSPPAAVRELQRRVRDILDDMDVTDREIPALQHFEQLANADAAAILGLRESTISMRFARALLRLKDILSEPGQSKN